MNSKAITQHNAVQQTHTAQKEKMSKNKKHRQTQTDTNTKNKTSKARQRWLQRPQCMYVPLGYAVVMGGSLPDDGGLLCDSRSISLIVSRSRLQGRMWGRVCQEAKS